MDKTDRNYVQVKCEILELMATEKHILQFLQKWVQRMEEVKPITQYSLFEFWERIQLKKDEIE